jgi:excisionase family DNA binding protein
MSLTLAEAAAACGVNKTTVLRAIKRGRITGVRDDGGTWRVEPVELFRVFEPTTRTDAEPVAVPRDATDAATDALVAELRAVIADLRSDREDLRQDRDHWREQAQRVALPAQQPAQRSWWRRIRGG